MSRTTLEQVEEFHRIFNHPIAENIGEETLETRQLRIKLLFEELGELAEASDCLGTWDELTSNHADVMLEDGNNVDHVAELDALCDLQVVLDGKFLTSGHWRHKKEAFAEVHRSNMSKADRVSQVKLESHIDHLVNIGKAETVTAKTKNKHTIFYREDGKILKGPNFKEPELKQFIK